jgi:hypothetical protein
MSNIELQKVLQGEQLDYNREKDALEKWMFSEGLAWDQKKFEAQLEAARKKSGGGCLKKTVGAVVGAGVGFVTGGPVGALVGGASAVMQSNGQDPSYLDSILNWSQTQAGHAGPVAPNTPGGESDYSSYSSYGGQSTG